MLLNKTINLFLMGVGKCWHASIRELLKHIFLGQNLNLFQSYVHDRYLLQQSV